MTQIRTLCILAFGWALSNGATLMNEIEPYRVIQRTSDTGADFTVQGVLQQSGAARVEARLSSQSDSVTLPGFDWIRVDTFLNGTAWAGKITSLPVGGEYRLQIRTMSNGDSVVETGDPVEHLLVGDLWACLGQSNIEGRAPFDSTSTDSAKLPPSPIPEVHVISPYSDGWALAKEPLSTGVSPCLAFAKRIYETTGIPIGIVRTRKGAPIQEWERGETGSAYFMLDTIVRKHCGGVIKGILWYQGENEALMSAIPALSGTGYITTSDYATSKAMAERYQALALRLFANLRMDFGTPETPVILAQLARIGGTMVWPAMYVREMQRRMGEWGPFNSSIVTIDLPLHWDALHLALAGEKEAGKRFADAALQAAYGVPANGLGPRFKRAYFHDQGRTAVVVVFHELNKPLRLTSTAVPDFFILQDDTMKVPVQSAALLTDSSLLLQWAGSINDESTVGYLFGAGPSTASTVVLTDSSGIPAMPFAFQPIADDSTASTAVTNTPPCPLLPVLTAYPNPFNPSTTIRMTGLPSRESVRLSIYDIRGGLVEEMRVPAARLAAGFTWNAARFGSGVYTLRVTADRTTMNTRLVYLK